MLQTKQCTKCNIVKPINMFVRCKKSKDGYTYDCKSCRIIVCEDRRKTKTGVIESIYSGQQSSSRRRGISAPIYTVIEIKEWALNQPIFNELYDGWIESGYKKMMKPSVDRVDDYKGYTFDNIQLMTWGENHKKGIMDKMRGNNNKQSKAVIGTNRENGAVMSFHSISQASRELNINQSHICSCCNNLRMSAGNYTWRFINYGVKKIT